MSERDANGNDVAEQQSVESMAARNPVSLVLMSAVLFGIAGAALSAAVRHMPSTGFGLGALGPLIAVGAITIAALLSGVVALILPKSRALGLALLLGAVCHQAGCWAVLALS